MTIKLDRLLVLKKVIELNRIGKQEDLLNILKQRGFALTQAPLSRDLKELKVSKIPPPGQCITLAKAPKNIRLALTIPDIYINFFMI